MRRTLLFFLENDTPHYPLMESSKGRTNYFLPGELRRLFISSFPRTLSFGKRRNFFEEVLFPLFSVEGPLEPLIREPLA